MAKGGVKTYEPDRQQPESDRLYTVKPDHGAPPQGCIFKGCRGSGKKKLGPVFEALAETDIPVKTFQPTHMSRNHELYLDGLKLAKMGGYIDITCEDFVNGEPVIGHDPMPALLEEAKAADVPMDHITFSSDGQGSWSSYDEAGMLKEIGVTDVGNMYAQMCSLVTRGGFDFFQIRGVADANSQVHTAFWLGCYVCDDRIGKAAVWNGDLSVVYSN